MAYKIGTNIHEKKIGKYTVTAYREERKIVITGNGVVACKHFSMSVEVFPAYRALDRVFRVRELLNMLKQQTAAEDDRDPTDEPDIFGFFPSEY